MEARLSPSTVTPTIQKWGSEDVSPKQNRSTGSACRFLHKLKDSRRGRKNATGHQHNRASTSVTPLDERLKTVTDVRQDQGPMQLFLTSASADNPLAARQPASGAGIVIAFRIFLLRKAAAPRVQVAPRYVKMYVVNCLEKDSELSLYGVDRIMGPGAPDHGASSCGEPGFLQLRSLRGAVETPGRPVADCRHCGSTASPPCQQRGWGRSEWKGSEGVGRCAHAGGVVRSRLRVFLRYELNHQSWALPVDARSQLSSSARMKGLSRKMTR
jgi:hypothetical protein